MTLPIDRTSKSSLDANLVNGNTSDAPVIKSSNDVVYNTIDELYNYALNLVNTGSLTTYPPGEYNKLTNGNLDVWQRGTSFTGITDGTGKYTTDRLYSFNNTSGGSSPTADQLSVTDLYGSKYAYRFYHTSNASNIGRLCTYYTIENKDSLSLAGKQMTVSVQVKSKAGFNKFDLRAKYRTTEGNIRSSATTIQQSIENVISTANWTKISLTFTVPTAAVLTANGCIGFELVGYNTISEVAGDGYILGQLQLCPGSVSLPFQPRDYEEELRKCRRYLLRFDSSVNANTAYALSQALSPTSSLPFIPFPVAMRVSPTLVASAASNFVLDGIACTAVSINQASPNSALLNVSVASGLTAGQVNRFTSTTNNLNSYLMFDAEL